MVLKLLRNLPAYRLEQRLPVTVRLAPVCRTVDGEPPGVVHPLLTAAYPGAGFEMTQDTREANVLIQILGTYR